MMERNYNSGIAKDVQFFFGKEVEHTPAFGMDTLFITGVHPVDVIESKLAETTYQTKHIFFGANHSYNPQDYTEANRWENMISHFLKKGYLCSLDIPLGQMIDFNDGGLNEYNNFIPQIRVPIPFIKLWNYNTMIKIDDTGFNKTNPGVWSHSLHTLMNRDCFTSWDKYNDDTIIK